MNKEEIKLKLIEIYYKYYDNMPSGKNIGGWIEEMLMIVGDSNE